MKKIVLIALFAAFTAAPTFAQCCGDKAKAAKAKVAQATPTAKKAKPLSARIAALEAKSEKGCQSSATQLAALKTFAAENCGAKKGCDTATLTREITDLEQWAEKGCKDSSAKLAKLSAALKSAKPKMTLSARFARLNAGATKGCKSSATKLVSLQKAAGTQCNATLAKQISDLESAATKGCASSKTKLAVLAASLKGKAKSQPASIEKSEKPKTKVFF